jgi:hypothetical protein
LPILSAGRRRAKFATGETAAPKMAGMSLPPPCRWLDTADASHLYWNYGCIAVVLARDGRHDMELTWQGRVRRGSDDSRAGAKARIERFVAAQPGLPRTRRRDR